MFNCATVDAESKARLLLRDIVEGAPAKMDLALVDMLHYIGLGRYLDEEPFDVLPVRG